MKHNKAENWAKHIDFILIDIVCMEAALFLANIVRYGLNMDRIFDGFYARFAVIAVVIFICLIFFMEPYSGVLRRDYLGELNSVIMVPMPYDMVT